MVIEIEILSLAFSKQEEIKMNYNVDHSASK